METWVVLYGDGEGKGEWGGWGRQISLLQEPWATQPNRGRPGPQPPPLQPVPGPPRPDPNPLQAPHLPRIPFPRRVRRPAPILGENLTYYTGIGYLSGSVAGAGKGLVEGIKASEPGDTLKLRVNRVLNASGHAGRRLGNRAGVIGLLYAGMESGMVALRDTDDVINSVAAGLGTGAAYRAAAGVRSAAVAGAIGGVVVGLAVAGKQAVKRYLPI
ncbi:hypothetical protein RJ639_014996 [Escallonia herrerae]|uniref:Mitochondrial import inner membrane translocase subunit TIM23 n=1 Tax=Escallonia herrerae TaxID=1293975 RepID=A0AA88VHL3_9ASTE|nr:hypothetical protein RJ639_014996 [Escallonia herrerae]